jgi:hypothetical protein
MMKGLQNGMLQMLDDGSINKSKSCSEEEEGPLSLLSEAKPTSVEV